MSKSEPQRQSIQSDSTMITYESVSAQQHAPLDTIGSSIPSHDTNETPNTRHQRMRKLQSLFSCLFPRAMENRWKNTCNLDSNCKGVQKNLIIKVCSIFERILEEFVDFLSHTISIFLPVGN